MSKKKSIHSLLKFIIFSYIFLFFLLSVTSTTDCCAWDPGCIDCGAECCTSGQTCYLCGCNHPCPICSDECTAGTYRCNSGVRQACGNCDGDSCREWCSSPCSTGYTCYGAGLCCANSGTSCDQGSDCCSGYDCIDTDLTCGGSAQCQAPSSTYDSRCCGPNGNSGLWTASTSGTIARTNANVRSCDLNEVADYSSDKYTSCYETTLAAPTIEILCDNDVAPSYSAISMCAYSTGTLSSSTVFCDISEEICYDGSYYRSDCSYCYTSGTTIRTCDSNGGTSYTPDGICVSGGSCDSGDVALDSGTYYLNCDTHGGNQCDVSVADGTFTQNGMCYDEVSTYGCLTSGFIFYNNSHYQRNSQIISSDYTNSSDNYDGKSCDSTITSGGDYSPDGIVNSSSLCQPVGSLIRIDQNDNYFKAGCDNSGDPCGTVSSSLVSPWAKEGVCCFNSCSGTATSECCDKSQCNGGQLCINSLCVDSSNITIQNLGTTGIENTNQEYTSTRNVFLNLEFSVNALKCRYINYDNPSSQPSNSSNDWTIWQPCVSSILWELSESSGIKTVYYQVNYTTYLLISNDSINYNYSGYGLDLTPPNKPNVYHINYTNDNQNITIYWTKSIDLESSIFGIPLIYNISLFNQSNVLIAKTTTTSKQYTFDIDPGLRQPHGVYLYANVTVINSAGLYDSAISNNLFIDTSGPNINILEGYFKNTTGSGFELMSTWNEDTWIYSPQINFTMNGSDSLSGLYGYSYLLTKNKNELIDNIPDELTSIFLKEKTKIYYNLPSGKYYFKVKALDKAGNWGNNISINFSVDNTPPSKPSILSKERNDDDYTFTWSESNDPESGIINYFLKLYNSDISINTTINDTSNRSFTFYNIDINENYTIFVSALNGAGRWSISDEEDETVDTTPPLINATPSATVITNYPILKAWTNEQSICYYNKSNSIEKFRYTNTTYHETKLDYSIDGPYTYEIRCKDMNENTASPLIINFTIDLSTSPADLLLEDNSAYEDLIKTISFQLKNAGDELTGINTNLIKFFIDGEEKECSVFDIGNSYYNISFKAPKAGVYTYKISYDNSIYDNALLTVTSLNFYSSYNDSSLLQEARTGKRLAYIDDVSRIGLATDSDTDLSQNSYNSKINLSSSHSDNVFIFNTKSSNNILSREKFLQSQNLNNLNMPSFGYGLKDTIILEFIIFSNEFNIKSNSTIVNPGKYLYLMSLEKNAGKKEVVMND